MSTYRNLSTDTQGRKIFSPWGDAGAAYFLQDRATCQRVIRLLNQCLVGYLLLFFWTLLIPLNLLPFALFPTLPLLLMLLYVAASRSIVRGLTVARERPLFWDYSARSSDAISFPFLLMLFIGSSFIACSFGWSLIRRSIAGGDLASMIVESVMCGVSACFCAYLLRIKWERTRQMKRREKAR